MKKTITHFVFLLAVFALIPAAQKFGVSLSGGYVMPQSNTYQAGIGYGFGLNFNFTKFLGLEVSALYNQGSVAEGEGSPGKGTLTRMPLQVNLVGRIPFGKKLVVMLLAGAHYSWNDYSLNDDVKKGLEPFGFTVESSMESSIGYQSGLGVEYLIGKKLALQLDGRYMMSQGKGKWEITDEVGGITTEGDLAEIKLDFVLVQVSLRYYFF